MKTRQGPVGPFERRGRTVKLRGGLAVAACDTIDRAKLVTCLLNQHARCQDKIAMTQPRGDETFDLDAEILEDQK